MQNKMRFQFGYDIRHEERTIPQFIQHKQFGILMFICVKIIIRSKGYSFRFKNLEQNDIVE